MTTSTTVLICKQVFQLAYEVKLRGIDDNPSLLLKSDFDTFMIKAVKVKYTLESVSQNLK